MIPRGLLRGSSFTTRYNVRPPDSPRRIPMGYLSVPFSLFHYGLAGF
jgi:hypothetical protein